MSIEGLGKQFQEARLARGLTVDEAARMTKIRPSRLVEIEADDFSQFPSLAYAKGFLLIYGKFLEVDVSPYLDAFETSSQMTVDGYSYLQEQEPAPKAHRSRAPVIRQSRSSRSGSPWPLLLAVGAIVLGFLLMRLFVNLQRLGPHTEQKIGVADASPVATAAPVIPATPVPTVTAKIVPRPTVAEVAAKKPESAPIIASSATPVPSTPAPIVVATPVQTPAVKVAEIRRAEPVKPEDLAKAGAAVAPSPTTEATGPNRVAIKPLKKTYIKVVVDNESAGPAFERWISPADGTVEFNGKHIAVRVLDREAIQIRKNGKPIADGDDDVTVE